MDKVVGEMEAASIAKKLPKGARRCLMLLTEEYVFPGLATFNANAAHNLSWRRRKQGGLAFLKVINGRAAYAITPLGLAVREHLQQAQHVLGEG